MIERLYLDNIRSFVNFEWRPEKLTLLLGRNGAGKTAIFDAIEAVQRFVTGETNVSQAIPDEWRTRWDTRSEQTVELDATIGSAIYQYRLTVAHDENKANGSFVVREVLVCDDHPVVEYAPGELRVFSGSQPVTMDVTMPTRSCVGNVLWGRDPRLERFQKWIRWISVLRPDPRAMSSRSDRLQTAKRPSLLSNLSNFAAWYPHALASKPGTMGHDSDPGQLPLSSHSAWHISGVS